METGPPGAFWQRVLAGSGYTPLPRWPGDSPRPVAVAGRRVPPATPGAPAAVHVTLPPKTARALKQLCERSAVALDTAVLAACAKVLAQVTADPAVVCGYRPRAGDGPVPCPVAVTDGTWSRLLADVARTESELVRHLPDYTEPPPSSGEAGTAPRGPLFDAVFVAGRAPRDEDLPADAVLAAGLSRDGDALTLVLRHRPRAVGGDQAGRLATYLLAALRALTEAPRTSHHEWSPVPEEEVAHQVHEWAGPVRELPDRRVHELFEEQVRLRPGDVAAVHGTTAWTYAELNQRANRIAHTLLEAGLRAEDVVGVVMERDLEWLASVLAVLKAGGVYLPVEPQFPAHRVTDMLRRAGCRHVLTRRGVSPALGTAAAPLPGLRTDHVEELLAAPGPVTDPKVPVAARQSAYLYFTSGSTGTPKGAVCEHAGFLNHLLAKIEDLGITEGTVVAQTAPQCFDISLWQLVAALAVGGRTVIVDQTAVQDVALLVDTLDRENVEILQVVPSYLETMLAELDRARRRLPRLRCVSATGEALKKELVERWFAACPEVPLVNAYGLTETSDDTNHEVMRRVPDRTSVPLGRPIANVRVYVLDEALRPVPLGSPGEIAFSGVCVGRGYVNDEERTRAAFVPDPLVPGERMYRSGDFGRWLPDGRLEFLGRRDAQVKIRGFRIEIGEIENALLRIPGVRDSAVIVVGTEERRQLAAFCTGTGHSADRLAAALGETLPGYMVPHRFHHLPELPLTGNGKTDRKALARIAEAPDAPDGRPAATEADGTAPSSDTERRLAGLWADVLKIPAAGIRRTSDFYALGGTSLSLIRLAIGLDRALSPLELRQTPLLADLAALLDAKTAAMATDAPKGTADTDD
ncbi:non-ribosomal peptide synthetase [Streptomyces naphthomycinicus]|uniref:non-ribosomal peptide synthetase n=1 Tax=Streptomyces naphthomycinicus TaxID=2872625 RepID=UPI001CEC5C84|nr:amino acid adenylation domain-containing protein [Streptomyces sp. TML10]